MGKYATFFFLMFVVCTFIASVIDGGGGIAATFATSAVGTSDTTISANNTTDFIGADATHPAYAMIGGSYFTYTSKDATHFYGVTQGVTDPITLDRGSGARAYPARTKIESCEVGALDAFMGYNVTTSNAQFGAYYAVTFAWRMFTNLPKFLTWNYNFLSTGQIIMLKYLLLYPLSAGFIFALGFAMLSLAMGLFKL